MAYLITEFLQARNFIALGWRGIRNNFAENRLVELYNEMVASFCRKLKVSIVEWFEQTTFPP